MRYTHLLFDLDGTLFDYDKAESQALETTFNNFKIAYDSAFLERYRALNKLIWQDFEDGKITQKKLKIQRFQNLSQAINVQFNPKSFSDTYLLNLSKNASLLPGAKKLITDIYSQIKLYLITNGLSIVQNPRIQNSEIGKYFNGMIISEEVGFAKPQKEIFDIAFNLMGNPEKNGVLIIGDSLSSDITGGKNYGIDTCWYNPKKTDMKENLNPTYEIHNLNELYSIIKI